MYAYPFSYHRAQSLGEVTKLLHQLGEEARVIAGGQSLIPLMKMRLARPSALIDINFIPGLSEIRNQNGELRFGALARHADIEMSEDVAGIPILHDCAAGIADVQVRNQGTIGGSLAAFCQDLEGPHGACRDRVARRSVRSWRQPAGVLDCGHGLDSILAKLGRSQIVDQTVCEAMAAYLMPAGRDLTNQPRVPLCYPAEDKESAPHMMALE